MLMKRILFLLLAGCTVVCAETKEQINKSFAAQPGGKLTVEVEFGSIQVTTNTGTEVTINVMRKIVRRSKADEETFLREHPVEISQDDNQVRVISRSKVKSLGWFRGIQRNEAKYIISVPAQFSAELKAAGGGITVDDLTGNVEAQTSGGGLKFARLRGPLHGETAGGGIRVLDCEGALKVNTSGGGIEVAAGSGSLEANTSGGSIDVHDFQGATHVETSGGGINLQNVAGRVEGSTSGGSISARLSSPSPEEVRLETSGGGVMVQVPETWAFNLDASTSGGDVSSEVPVTVVGKTERSSLRGTVNGGGKPIFLRTSGGSIRIHKL